VTAALFQSPPGSNSCARPACVNPFQVEHQVEPATEFLIGQVMPIWD
jgi:hypothetical protein